MTNLTCATCGNGLMEKKIIMQKISCTVKNETFEFGVKLNAKCCPNHTTKEDMVVNAEDMIAFGNDLVDLTKEISGVDSKRKLNLVLNKINENQEKYTVEIVA